MDKNHIILAKNKSGIFYLNVPNNVVYYYNQKNAQTFYFTHSLKEFRILMGRNKNSKWYV